MLALIIIGCVVLFFVLLLLLPVGARIDYSAEGLKLYLKVAFLHFLLYPGKEKVKKSRKEGKKAKKKPGKEGAKPDESEQKQEKKLGNLDWLLDLTKPALRALGQLRRKLKVNLIQVEYCIGGASDPADAAIQYGIISAGGGVLFPLLNTAFDVRNWDVNVGVDFEQEKSRVAMAVQGTWMLGSLIRILFSLGLCALKAYRNRKEETGPATKTAITKEDIQHGRKASDR